MVVRVRGPAVSWSQGGQETTRPDSKPGGETEFPFSASLFCSGPGPVGGGPPALGRAVCVLSQQIRVLLLSRNTLTDTLTNVESGHSGSQSCTARGNDSPLPSYRLQSPGETRTIRK